MYEIEIFVDGRFRKLFNGCFQGVPNFVNHFNTNELNIRVVPKEDVVINLDRNDFIVENITTTTPQLSNND